MRESLKRLLDRLDAIESVHEEVGDTAVREAMSRAIRDAWIVPIAGYELPDEFEMFSPDGDSAVRTALGEFVALASREAEERGLTTAQQRFNAFQDPEIRSQRGSQYDEYFGHADSLESISPPDPWPPRSAADPDPPGPDPAKPWWRFW